MRWERYVLRVLVLLLLFAAGLRIQHLVEFVEWPDEIRSMWRTQGSLDNLLIRTPDDWPPLYGITVWGWVRLVGPTLEASRYLSLLFSLLGLACLYRAARRFIKGSGWNAQAETRAALLASAAFATMSYLVFEGVDVRAYSLLLFLGTLAVWLTLRWLERPTWRRGIMLLIVLVVMFYSSFTSILLIAFLTLFILLLKPRLLFLWGSVGIGVLILTLPIVPKFIQNAPGRVSNRIVQELPPFGEAMLKIYQDFGGAVWFFILLLAACAIVMWMAARFPESRRRALLLAGWIVVPAVVYIVVRNGEFMKPRYLWWVGIGLALLLSYAATRLPVVIQWGTLAFIVVLPVFPVDFYTYRLSVTSSPPFRETFAWFSKQLRPGDVLVIDPNCACGERFAWDYFVPQYFPTGYLPVVDRPGTASRVWYLSTAGWPRDEMLLAEVQKGRKSSIFYGPWFFLLQLYEGPPSWEGIAFADKLRLHGAEIEYNNTVMAKDESFRVKLWWSTQQPLDQDYSISVAVLNAAGQLVAQADGPARAVDTPERISAWQPGIYYEDFRDFRLPADLPDGTYYLVATVYQWWDGLRLTAANNPIWRRMGEGDTYVVLKEIAVVS